MGASPIFEGAFLSHAYGRMAEIYDRQGETDLAIELYTRLVTRWKDADARFQARVDSARARLKQLAATQ
jgi:hypothetical protein